MVTILNNPPSTINSDGTASTNSAVNLIIGLALMIILGVFLFNFLPSLTRSMRPSAPSINVPEQVDVNVNTPPGQ